MFHQLKAISLETLIAAIKATPPWRIAVALAFTGVSFAALASYDVIAVQVVAPDAVPLWGAVFAGAAANAVSNTLGFHPITASAVRFRVYRRWGLSLPSTGRVVALSWAALGLGFAGTLGGALLIDAPSTTYRISGIVLALATGALVIWMTCAPRTVRVAGLTLDLPHGWRAVTQLGIGAIETGATIAALYVLIPGGVTHPSFPVFCLAFIGAVLLGIASHAPGGVGVFEAAMLTLFPSGQAAFLAALLLFRALYNLLPFVLAVLGLILFELSWRAGKRG
ncbi:MAG: UPF0104 family protein [Alphaproteobacteria bacterium]|nr:UPF0104 family protein [Alphaproteobacteria bacterium]